MNVPYENEKSPNEVLTDVGEQALDLLALKRQKAIFDILEDHHEALRDAITHIHLVLGRLDASSRLLHRGAMPVWYESFAEHSNSALLSAAASLDLLSKRIVKEYIG